MTPARSFALFLTKRPYMELDQAVIRSLDRGVAVLQTETQLDTYFQLFGKKHHGRIAPLVAALVERCDIVRHPFRIADWGCGAGTATFLLLEALQAAGFRQNVQAVVGFDASRTAVERFGTSWWGIYGAPQLSPKLLVGPSPSAAERMLATCTAELPTLHIAANFLDIDGLGHHVLASATRAHSRPGDVFAAVSPTRPVNLRTFEASLGFERDVHHVAYNALHGNHDDTYAFLRTR